MSNLFVRALETGRKANL